MNSITSQVRKVLIADCHNAQTMLQDDPVTVWNILGRAADMLAADAVLADKRVDSIAADREYWREQAQRVAVPTNIITAAIMRDDDGEKPAWCVMVAYRSQNDAQTVLELLTHNKEIPNDTKN